MTFCRKYVGDAAGFEWREWCNKLPPKITRDFPAMGSHWYGHHGMTSWAERNRIFCIHYDFDGYAARVSKDQIQQFLHEVYDSDRSYCEPEAMKLFHWLNDELAELRQRVDSLPDDGEYALVSECC